VNSIRDTSKELESVLEVEFSNLFRANLFIKINSWYLQTKERNGSLRTFFEFIGKNQQTVFGFLAYMAILGMLYYVLKIIPKSG